VDKSFRRDGRGMDSSFILAPLDSRSASGPAVRFAVSAVRVTRHPALVVVGRAAVAAVVQTGAVPQTVALRPPMLLAAVVA
jgi:hypothetical protein